MQLSQLRTFLRHNILNDRTDRDAGTSDYLWTDESLTTFINEAQRRFAVRSFALRDATTPEVTEVELVEGQINYTLHPSVFAVISAKYEDATADLVRVGHSLLGAYRAPSDTWVDPDNFTALPPGAVLAYSTDEEISLGSGASVSQVSLRLYPKPNAQQAGRKLRLRVVRKPLERLTAEDDVPEIPEDHHIEMLDWAAYLALRIVDDDAGSPKRAAEFAGSFEEHIKAARLLVMRKLFAPMPWGFGRGGFTWSN